MSMVSLPGDLGYTDFLAGMDAIYRGVHPWDLDNSVSVDGYGTLDNSGGQNRITMLMAFAQNMLDSRQDTTTLYGPPVWEWAYLIRQTAHAIVSKDGEIGIADASSAHDSGYGFVWDSHAISLSSTAWWVLTTLDFHPFMPEFEGFAYPPVLSAQNATNGVVTHNHAGPTQTW